MPKYQSSVVIEDWQPTWLWSMVIMWLLLLSLAHILKDYPTRMYFSFICCQWSCCCCCFELTSEIFRKTISKLWLLHWPLCLQDICSQPGPENHTLEVPLQCRHMRVKTSRLKSRMFIQLIDQINNKENIKVLHYWPLVRGIHMWPLVSLAKGQ